MSTKGIEVGERSTVSVGESDKPFAEWRGRGVRTTADQITEDGEHYHVAMRTVAGGERIRVSFKYDLACPLGAAGVYLRSTRRPTTNH